MLNGFTIYTLLDCTWGYHHISLSPESQKKSDFVTLLSLNSRKYFWSRLVPCAFPTINKWSPEGPSFCFRISRWHPHLKWKHWKASWTSKSLVQWIMNTWCEIKKKEMWLFQMWTALFKQSNIWKSYLSLTWEIAKYQRPSCA